MSDKPEPSPRPWRVADGMQETIVDERNNIFANASNNATAALIVDAVNHIEETKRLSIKLYDPIKRAEAERDRIRDELTRKAQNYEDVIAFHTRTEDRLRDLVRRFADLSESLLANYEYRYREDVNSMAFVENTRGFLREARAAIGEDKP